MIIYLKSYNLLQVKKLFSHFLGYEDQFLINKKQQLFSLIQGLSSFPSPIERACITPQDYSSYQEAFLLCFSLFLSILYYFITLPSNATLIYTVTFILFLSAAYSAAYIYLIIAWFIPSLRHPSPSLIFSPIDYLAGNC